MSFYDEFNAPSTVETRRSAGPTKRAVGLYIGC